MNAGATPSVQALVELVHGLEDRVLRLEQALALRQTPGVGEPRRGPYQQHSSTSRLAALHNAPRSGTQRHRILNYLIDRGERGATRQEIATALHMSDDSVRPRIVELIEGGWATASEKTRPTQLGEQAEVVTATRRALLEHDLKIEETRTVVSSSPVVSDGSAPARHGAPPGAPPVHADGGHPVPGPSETLGLFDPIGLAKPAGAYDDVDAVA